MGSATSSATTAQTAIQAADDVQYITEIPAGYTFEVTPHAPTKR